MIGWRRPGRRSPLALMALKRRRDNAGDQGHGARGRDRPRPSAHERVEIDLLAFSATLIRAGEPKTSVASPSALIPRSSGPRQIPSKGRLVESTVMAPTTRHGVGASSPGAVPVERGCAGEPKAANPAAGSPSSAPSNSAAGQLGPRPLKAERRPFRPRFSEASLKTTGALSGPENWPLRRAGPSSEGAAASISTPESRFPAAPTIFTRPSRTLGGQTRSNGGPPSGPAVVERAVGPRVRVRTASRDGCRRTGAVRSQA